MRVSIASRKRYLSSWRGVSTSPEWTYAETRVSVVPSGRRTSFSIQRPESSKYSSPIPTRDPVGSRAPSNASRRVAIATPARPFAAASVCRTSHTSSLSSSRVILSGARTS